ncbi:MAG: DUF222 domain-containing protein [Segniliparus sp.]|uniref:HNH endonuclease signature motif containing protein n=1 Tax=Segniliparus sp. TaxID=2804064 RepID=UPI003F3880E3
MTPVSDGTELSGHSGLRPARLSDLRGTMPLEAAAELRERLDAIARTVCPDDPRPIFTRHSDALAILGSEHQLACQCDKPTCKAAQRPARHAKNIELVVQLPALIGKDDIPALLDGAPIDPELARMLAKTAKRIKFTTDPDQYKPAPALETHVNARDQHCRFPGCYRSARTELDHTVPFDHEDPSAGGFTVPDNLKRLCRHHPPPLAELVGGAPSAKTHGHWRDQQSPDGTVHWTSPTGQHHTTNPG